MQPIRVEFPRGRPWPVLVLLALGLVALTAGFFGGEYAATVAYGSSL